MRSFWIGRGDRVLELENMMKSWVGARHAVVLGSGTCALVVALNAISSPVISYEPVCDALDIAVRLSGKGMGAGPRIAIYPSQDGEIVDFARHLPRFGEVLLKSRFGVFSFGALKDVSGGIGGAVVSNEPIDAGDWKRVSPLSDINAAMILSQLSRYDGKVSKRLVAGGLTWCASA
jgi:dTDP-4-amino-4,6-dideoxygalactose transaminase